MSDPYDEESLAGFSDLITETFDPEGKFRSFGVPCLGGGFHIEPASYVAQDQGLVYKNFHVWLRRTKEALHPSYLNDWSA